MHSGAQNARIRSAPAACCILCMRSYWAALRDAHRLPYAFRLDAIPLILSLLFPLHEHCNANS